MKYGNNIGCFARELIKISEDDYNSLTGSSDEDEDERRRRMSSDDLYSNVLEGDGMIEITDHRSGNALPDTYLALIDMYSQLVGDDDSRLTNSIIFN